MFLGFPSCLRLHDRHGCTEDAVLRGDEAAVRSWLERGGRANTTREYGEVTGVTLLMDAKGVLLNLVLPYDMLRSPQGFFGCIQSIHDHWA